MASEHSPHFPVFSFHEKKALAGGQRSQIVQFEFDLAVIASGLEKKDSFRVFRAIHANIIPQSQRGDRV